MKKILIYILPLFLLFSCNNDNKKYDKIVYFKKSIILKNETLPIVDFSINSTKVTFILDTGSELSFIDDDIYKNKEICYTKLKTKELTINTINGTNNSKQALLVETILDDSIQTYLYVTDIDNVIEQIFINNGIVIQGILGCDFLYRHKAIIDFENKALMNIKK